MPTPHYYLKAVRSGRGLSKTRPRIVMLTVIGVLIVGTILGRLWPAFDKVYGRCLFVFMVWSWTILPPSLAFRKKGLAKEEPTVTAGDWIKAVLCDLWTLLCIWFVYLGVFHPAT